MKTRLITLTILVFIGMTVFAQRTTQFEEPKNTEDISKVKVHVGGDFALQFQGLTQELQVVKPIQNCLIKGTSTMHDWELNISQINGKIEVTYRDWETDRKSTRLNSSHITRSRMPSSA